MADGTISLADGLGLKALDSNELRRRQQVLDPSKSPHFHPSPMKVETQQGGNSGDSSPKTSKQSSPSRKLHQVFEEALVREAEERASVLLAGNTKIGNISDHIISQDMRVEDEVALKGSVPPSGAHSPKSQNNPNPNAAQKIQQTLFEDGLKKEADARARVTHLHGNTYQFQRTPSEVRKSNPNSKILLNARGNPYVEGDPNMGYSLEDTQPRYRQVQSNLTLPIHQSHNPKSITGQSRPKPKNWASLLQSQRPSLDMELDYFPDLQKGKEALVEIDLELTEVGKWNRYLVGHFLDGKMPYALLFSTARNQWKELFVAVKTDVAGFYLFEFKDEQAKQQVLEGGPYFFSQKYLVLKDWHRMLKPAQEQPSKIPAWVKFHDLPFELWNKECLSQVASTIGRPLHVDQAIAKSTKQPGLIHTKSSKARICIEINAEHDLPEEVTVVVVGEYVIIPVEYQVLPPMCSVCHVFGHSNVQCAKKASTSSSLSKVEVQNENAIHVGNVISSLPQ
ncbi:hypothetical protein RHGRI_026448 [Rhododendron griersonianum]|uniref:DUF4283 domain-containing protein n=1 Tax=Rhododendron griersonianum TaxID=479676 RepID=A0AAV6ITA4_9ERIC|nr:hypothetical protein RHGRI_026448 [Rhododendron griersonianum]